MEAMRIRKVVGAKPRRTIRIALWGAEEQGLMGSRAYVREHFADAATMQLTPGHGKISAYFNSDNGTGKTAACGCTGTCRSGAFSRAGSSRRSILALRQQSDPDAKRSKNDLLATRFNFNAGAANFLGTAMNADLHR